MKTPTADMLSGNYTNETKTNNNILLHPVNIFKVIVVVQSSFQRHFLAIALQARNGMLGRLNKMNKLDLETSYNQL